MLGEIGGHRSNDCQLVGQFSHVWEKLADPGPALSALLECPWGLHHLSHIPELGGLNLVDDLARILPVMLGQHRLVVKGVDMRNPTIHEQEDHTLCAWRVMCNHRCPIQIRQGQATEAKRGLLQEIAAGDERILHFR